MKISYLTILVAGGLFSAIAIASFSRYRKGSQRKELQNEHKDEPRYTPRQDSRYSALIHEYPGINKNMGHLSLICERNPSAFAKSLIILRSVFVFSC